MRELMKISHEDYNNLPEHFEITSEKKLHRGKDAEGKPMIFRTYKLGDCITIEAIIPQFGE